MNQELIQYIKDGIYINKTSSGYKIFTPRTQNFNIDKLEELTPEKFEDEIKKIELSRKSEIEKTSSEQEALKQSISNTTDSNELSWEFFKHLFEIEPISNFTLKNGIEVPVRNKCIMKTQSGVDYEVYLHSMTIKNRKQPSSNEIGFIFVLTKTLMIYSMSDIKKIVKEIIVL